MPVPPPVNEALATREKVVPSSSVEEPRCQMHTDCEYGRDKRMMHTRIGARRSSLIESPDSSRKKNKTTPNSISVWRECPTSAHATFPHVHSGCRPNTTIGRRPERHQMRHPGQRRELREGNKARQRGFRELHHVFSPRERVSHSNTTRSSCGDSVQSAAVCACLPLASFPTVTRRPPAVYGTQQRDNTYI